MVDQIQPWKWRPPQKLMLDEEMSYTTAGHPTAVVEHFFVLSISIAEPSYVECD